MPQAVQVRSTVPETPASVPVNAIWPALIRCGVARQLASYESGVGVSTTIDQYQWRDGWTVTGGVVHSFSEAFGGSVSLTWDRGVTTGWDLRNDVWTLALGGRLRSQIGGEFRFGLGLSYLAAAQETQYANAIIPGNIHSGFNQAADSGFATTLNVGFITQW